MDNYIKLLKFKPTTRLKMEAKIKGTASPEDAGKAIKASYTIASIGLSVMLSCFGVAAVIFSLAALL